MIATCSPVQEILPGCLYDVADIRGEVIGEEVPAWVARVIAACDPGIVLVRVHASYSDLPRPGVVVQPGNGTAGPARASGRLGRFFTW
jgi:hypothetical protein